MKRLIAIAISAALILAGCASEPEIGEASSKIRDSSEVSAGDEAESTEESSLQTSEIEPESQSPQGFEEVLSNSCGKALEVGVVETSRRLEISYILFPEELSIDGYSAVEHNLSNGEVSLVWETDVFYTCYFSNRLDMAEEFGTSALMSFKSTPGGFEIVDESLEETLSFDFKVTSGFIDEIDDGDAVWSVIYGVGEDKLVLLEQAIQDFQD